VTNLLHVDVDLEVESISENINNFQLKDIEIKNRCK